MADRLYGNLTDAAADDILDGLLATCYVALARAEGGLIVARCR